MKILVTGGAGFVGTNLIKRLLSDGHIVKSVDDYSTGKIENHIDHENVEYSNSDINYCWQLNHESSDARFDIIFHLAAVARIQPSFEQPRKYIDTNFNGTYRIVEYCAKYNIPLIYAGSSSHHSGKFKNPYTFSKDLGEDVIKLYQEHFGLKASIARFYNVYGPHQLTEGGYTTLIGRWLNELKNGKQSVIYGNGFKCRDFTHVDDIVDGITRIMKQQAYGHIFELGRGKSYSINEVAVMFNIIPNYLEDKPGEAQETLSDSSLAHNLLAWDPKINLKDYITEQIIFEKN